MCAQRWSRVERIGGLIAGALPARVQRQMAGWLAVDVWPRVVGREAARRSAAVAFRDGRLTVEVINSAWLHRLTLSSHHYLRQLNQEVDSVEVSEIIYRVNPGLRPSGDEEQSGPERAEQDGRAREANDGATREANDGVTRETDRDDESVQRQRGRRGLGNEGPAGG